MNPRKQAPSANDKYDEKSIFKQAMAGNWKDLVTDFKMPDFEQDKKITKAEDTILHMAVNSGNKSDTKKLVDGVRTVEVLRATNKEKNTPLHLAAALGYNDLCEYMIEKEKKIIPAVDKEVRLIKSRNGVGETPFFTSADQIFNHLKFSYHNVSQPKTSAKQQRNRGASNQSRIRGGRSQRSPERRGQGRGRHRRRYLAGRNRSRTPPARARWIKEETERRKQSGQSALAASMKTMPTADSATASPLDSNADASRLLPAGCAVWRPVRNRGTHAAAQLQEKQSKQLRRFRRRRSR